MDSLLEKFKPQEHVSAVKNKNFRPPKTGS